MKIENIRIQNFRCFGHEIIELNFEEVLTVFVGGNGSGKTAVLQAVSRLFGTSSAQRSIQCRDFHIPIGQQGLQSGDSLFVEAILVFPELALRDGSSLDAVPEFFNQMAASGEGEPLKARIRLQATWTDDGTPEGTIEEDIRWIRALDDNFEWDDCSRVQAVERSSIQFIYLPANRDATTQVTSLLKGRLWLAAKWSTAFRDTSTENAGQIQSRFEQEGPSMFLLGRLSNRWKQVHEADTLKTGGNPALYTAYYDDVFKWYPYLFLNRSKPETHLAAFSRMTNCDVSLCSPAELRALIEYVKHELVLSGEDE